MYSKIDLNESCSGHLLKRCERDQKVLSWVRDDGGWKGAKRGKTTGQGTIAAPMSESIHVLEGIERDVGVHSHDTYRRPLTRYD